MSRNGYPPAMDEVRQRLEALSLLPPEAAQWPPFMRDIVRMPMWMLPAVHAAIHQRVWTPPGDPLQKLRGAVRKLAIEMHLSNSEAPTMAQLLPDDEEEAS